MLRRRAGICPVHFIVVCEYPYFPPTISFQFYANTVVRVARRSTCHGEFVGNHTNPTINLGAILIRASQHQRISTERLDVELTRFCCYLANIDIGIAVFILKQSSVPRKHNCAAIGRAAMNNSVAAKHITNRQVAIIWVGCPE